MMLAIHARLTAPLVPPGAPPPREVKSQCPDFDAYEATDGLWHVADPSSMKVARRLSSTE